MPQSQNSQKIVKQFPKLPLSLQISFLKNSMSWLTEEHLYTLMLALSRKQRAELANTIETPLFEKIVSAIPPHKLQDVFQFEEKLSKKPTDQKTINDKYLCKEIRSLFKYLCNIETPNEILVETIRKNTEKSLKEEIKSAKKKAPNPKNLTKVLHSKFQSDYVLYCRQNYFRNLKSQSQHKKGKTVKDSERSKEKVYDSFGLFGMTEKTTLNSNLEKELKFGFDSLGKFGCKDKLKIANSGSLRKYSILRIRCNGVTLLVKKGVFHRHTKKPKRKRNKSINSKLLEKFASEIRPAEMDVFVERLGTKIGPWHRMEVMNRISKELSPLKYEAFSRLRSLSLLSRKSLRNFKAFLGVEISALGLSSIRFLCFLMWSRVCNIVEVASLLARKRKLGKEFAGEMCEFNSAELEEALRFVETDLNALRDKKLANLIENRI